MVKEKAKAANLLDDRPRKMQKPLEKGYLIGEEKGKPTRSSIRLKVAWMLNKAKLPPNTYNTLHVITNNDEGQSKVKSKASKFTTTLATINATYSTKEYLKTRRLDFEYFDSINVNVRTLFEKLGWVSYSSTNLPINSKWVREGKKGYQGKLGKSVVKNAGKESTTLRDTSFEEEMEEDEGNEKNSHIGQGFMDTSDGE
ncbi:hypothetical protein Syun_023485 [Stephania yunnanensis]|uniref:Uncharacterized protein n=1 Tax=Stephania yunnanensis TaxID=152371 RepID=A0AAP0I3T9_9MAGN